MACTETSGKKADGPRAPLQACTAQSTFFIRICSRGLLLSICSLACIVYLFAIPAWGGKVKRKLEVLAMLLSDCGSQGPGTRFSTGCDSRHEQIPRTWKVPRDCPSSSSVSVSLFFSCPSHLSAPGRLCHSTPSLCLARGQLGRVPAGVCASLWAASWSWMGVGKTPTGL